MTTKLSLIANCTLLIANCLAQGNIDIDTNIQMGIAGNEHVKITTNNFSIHQDAASPLIYGDFGTGNVGIGTNSPGGQLHLASNQNHSVKITRSSGLYGFQIFRNAAEGRFYLQNTDDNSNWGTRIRIDEGGPRWQDLILNPDGGKVGIGTTSPNETLDVNGSLKTNGTIVTNSSTLYLVPDNSWTNTIDIPNINGMIFFHISSNGATDFLTSGVITVQNTGWRKTASLALFSQTGGAQVRFKNSSSSYTNNLSGEKLQYKINLGLGGSWNHRVSTTIFKN